MEENDPISPMVMERLDYADDTLDADLNMHDRVAVMIGVCIEEGLTNASLIRLALKRRGYNVRHVSIMLQEGPGNVPDKLRWYQSPEGDFRLP